MKGKESRFRVLHNPEKKHHETWYPGRHLLNIPHPFRAAITGPPNSGKTMSILNLLANQSPPFEVVFLIHPKFFLTNPPKDQEEKNTDIMISSEEVEVPEYKYVDFIGLKYLPSTSFFESPDTISMKKCLIIDDIDLKEFCKNNTRKQRLNKLLTYVSTHSNLSLMVTCQDMYSQNFPILYRLSDFISIFRFYDYYFISLLARNIGVDKDFFKKLLTMIPGDHECFQIDKTTGTPARYRLNYETPVDGPEFLQIKGLDNQKKSSIVKTQSRPKISKTKERFLEVYRRIKKRKRILQQSSPTKKFKRI